MSSFYKTVVFAAALMVLGGCSASETEISPSMAVGAVNPLKGYESVEAMAQAVEFVFQMPAELPAGYEISACYTVSDQVVSIEYTNGEREALYRTAEVSDEYDRDVSISGNYTVFAEKETVQIGSYAVTFSYDTKEAPGLALWSDGTMLYSLDGFSMEEAETCILSLTEADF